MKASVFSTDQGYFKTGVVFAVCAVFVLSVIVGHVPYYETGDDIMINLISAGAFGGYRQYLVHTNVLYGYFLLILQTIAPRAPWYYICLVLFNYLALVSVCLVLTKKLTMRNTVVVSAVVSFVCSEPFFQSLQYTKYAFFYTIAGSLLLFEALSGTEESAGSTRFRTKVLAGSLLFLLGFLIRDKCFLFMLPFFAVLCVFAVYDGNGRKKLQSAVRTLLPAFLMVILAFLINKAHYLVPEWRGYQTFNATRESIMDYTGVHYEQNREAYDAAGITPEALNAFRMFLYNDPGYFTQDTLDEIVKIEYASGEHSLRLSTQAVADTAKSIAYEATHVYYGMAWAATLLLLLIFGTNRTRLLVCIQAAVLFAEYYYLVCAGRPYARALIGGYLAAFLMPLAFHFHAGASRRMPFGEPVSKAALVLAILLLAVYPAKQGMNLFSRKGGQLFADSGSNDDVFRRMREDANHIYIGFENYFNDNPWQITAARYAGFFENFCFLGDWFVPSPISANTTDLENPMRALVTEESARFYGTKEQAEAVRDYLKRVFQDEGIRTEQEGDQFWVFKRTTQP